MGDIIGKAKLWISENPAAAGLLGGAAGIPFVLAAVAAGAGAMTHKDGPLPEIKEPPRIVIKNPAILLDYERKNVREFTIRNVKLEDGLPVDIDGKLSYEFSSEWRKGSLARLMPADQFEGILLGEVARYLDDNAPAYVDDGDALSKKRLKDISQNITRKLEALKNSDEFLLSPELRLSIKDADPDLNLSAGLEKFSSPEYVKRKERIREAHTQLAVRRAAGKTLPEQALPKKPSPDAPIGSCQSWVSYAEGQLKLGEEARMLIVVDYSIKREAAPQFLKQFSSVEAFEGALNAAIVGNVRERLPRIGTLKELGVKSPSFGAEAEQRINRWAATFPDMMPGKGPWLTVHNVSITPSALENDAGAKAKGPVAAP